METEKKPQKETEPDERDKDPHKTLEKNPVLTYLIIYRPEGVYVGLEQSLARRAKANDEELFFSLFYFFGDYQPRLEGSKNCGRKTVRQS